MIQDLHRIIELIEGDWRKKRVLVLGDIMLDRYIWGNVERISPEAPVPVVLAARSNERPGGAANVAMNIAGLGAETVLYGFCGEDADSRILEDALRGTGVASRMTKVAAHPTTTKLRILSGKQQMLRLDTEQVDGYPAEAHAELIAQLKTDVSSADAVVLSDYAKGVLTEEVCQQVIRAAREAGVPVLVDPKHKNLERYRGATTICPNLSELSAAAGVSARELETLLQAGQRMVAPLGLDFITATLSEKGIAVLRSDSRFMAPAVARQVFDVSGAGDTVIATLALALAGGLEIETAVQLANIAAGIVVGKVGTVPITRDELLTSLTPEIDLQPTEKVLTLEHLKVRSSAWRSAARRWCSRTDASICCTSGT